MLLWDPFRSHFWTPRTPKNHALAVARCYFSQKWHDAPGSPKWNPKWSQNRAPNDPQRLSNSPKDNSKSALDFWSNFSSILDDFGGSKMTPKSMLKLLSAPNGRLETSRAPFGEHLGSILVSFEALGANFRACWVHVGFIFELCLQAPRPPALITPRTYFLILSSFP